MTNEEKAEELRKTALPNPLPDGYGMWLSAGDVDEVLIKMAKWKESQMIEKACEWLDDAIQGGVHPQSTISFVKQFKKAMEE